MSNDAGLAASALALVGALLWETWNALLVAAPFLLLGLFAGGLLHLLLPRRLVERWMGQEGLLGVVVAALFGIPLPLCSCGVVPVAIALRRKGASRAASASFLISTPESGVDSILLTYGMLGPLMAIARPLASFATALLAGAATIAWPDTGADAAAAAERENAAGEEPSAIGLRELGRSLVVFLMPKRAGDAAPAPPFEAILADATRYGFVELLDDIVFWLVIGLLLAGRALLPVAAALPADARGARADRPHLCRGLPGDDAVARRFLSRSAGGRPDRAAGAAGRRSRRRLSPGRAVAGVGARSAAGGAARAVDARRRQPGRRRAAVAG